MAAPPLPGLPGRVALQLGRRGTVLVCDAVIWMIYGSSVVGNRVERFSRPGPSPLDWLDSPHWGLMFLAGGVVALVAAAVPRLRASSLGYNALVLPAVLWVLAYGWSFLVHVATGGDYGEPRTLGPTIIWAAVVVMLIVINGWEEPSGPLQATDGGGAQ